MQQDDASAAVATEPGRKRALRRLMPAALLAAWPFVYFLPVVCGGAGPCRGLSNDFRILYYDHKVYLLDGLSRLRLPLWSPSEAAGFPFYSNPFTQAFYPLNLPLALFYRLAGGYSALDHQRFTVLGVSILCVGLYAWLRSLELPVRSALVASAVLGVSFKVGEILRFPNAVHAAAWYPWLLWAITRASRGETLRRKLGAASLLAVFACCALTAGYPYYLYYALFLVGPYLAVLLVPRLAQWLDLPPPRRPLLAAGVIAAAGVAALLLCGPYLLKMLQLLNQTHDRGGGDFAYSTAYHFGPEDTLGSLLYPPAAQAEGWYYFGIAALLLSALHLVAGAARWPSRLFLLLWIAGISGISWGRDSPLFRLAWEVLPHFSRLRVWGRLNIVLVPLLAWLLARAWTDLEGLDPARARRWLAWLAGIYAAVLGTQAWLFVHGVEDPYWRDYFQGIRPPEAHYLWAGFAGFAGLALLLAWTRRGGLGRTGRWLAAAALLAASTADMTPLGNRMWTKPSLGRDRRVVDIERQARDSLEVRRREPYGTIQLSPSFSVGVVDNWYFERYTRFRARTEGEQPARLRLLGVTARRRVFFTRILPPPELMSLFLQDAAERPDAVRVISYDGDDLQVEVTAPVAGFLSFIDNWDPDWEARVDGAPACVLQLFDTFKAVKLPPGVHQVELRYRPRLWRANPCDVP